jgi:hypothetical protein
MNTYFISFTGIDGNGKQVMANMDLTLDKILPGTIPSVKAIIENKLSLSRVMILGFSKYDTE